jgi:hypothetical protein
MAKQYLYRKTKRAGRKGQGKKACKRNCTRYVKRTLRMRSRQKGGNSATLRDPAKYNDLVDVIYDPEERDGFSAPVLVSRDTHNTMFGIDSEGSDSDTVSNLPRNNYMV